MKLDIWKIIYDAITEDRSDTANDATHKIIQLLEGRLIGSDEDENLTTSRGNLSLLAEKNKYRNQLRQSQRHILHGGKDD